MRDRGTRTYSCGNESIIITKCEHLGKMLTETKEPSDGDPTGPRRKTSIKIDVEVRRIDYPSFLKNCASTSK